MILKSLSRKSNSAQLIKYVLRYALKENDSSKSKDDATLILKHNLRSRSAKGYIKEFADNESYRIYRRKDSVTVFHDIVSFAPDDKDRITDGLLKTIAKKYVELRGEHNLYLAVAHKEKAHTHLHIVVSGVQLNGYSSRISKQQFRHLKIELDKFQHEKFPEIASSLIPHGKSYQKSKSEIVELVKNARQTEKQKLLNVIEQTYGLATSQEDFLNRLKALSYESYHRNNVLQGVIVEGRKFRLHRLGYNKQKIEELNHKIATEEQALQELQSLRSWKSKELKKQIQVNQKKTVVVDKSATKMLDELANIRNAKETRERESPIMDSVIERSEFNKSLNNPGCSIEDCEISVPNLFSLLKPNMFINEPMNNFL